MAYTQQTKRLALKRVQDALFHLSFKDRIKVIIATLKQLDIKASDLEDKANEQTK